MELVPPVSRPNQRRDEDWVSTRNNSSWQEDAARLLLDAGFIPSDKIGQVEHRSRTHGAERIGRTFGSVWRAMCSLVENAPE